MKCRTSLLIILIFAFVLISNAQVKQISSRDYYASSSKAYELMSERPRRIIVKTENFENGGVVNSTVKTEERISPERMRFVTIERKGNEEKVSEIIRIGTKIYSRENNGQWTVIEVPITGRFGSGATFNANCMQYTEEETFIEGVSAKKLNNLEIYKGEKGLTFDSFSVWYDQQGFFLRSERVKGLLDPRIEESRSVATYEYEPKDLKIEAPIK